MTTIPESLLDILQTSYFSGNVKELILSHQTLRRKTPGLKILRMTELKQKMMLTRVQQQTVFHQSQAISQLTVKMVKLKRKMRVLNLSAMMFIMLLLVLTDVHPDLYFDQLSIE